MTELNKFFIQPDNHLQTFHISLTTIYQDHLVAQCAPSIISHNAKYKHPTPKVNQVASYPFHPTNDNEVMDSDNDEDTLHNPSINAARQGKQSDNESSAVNYLPTRCKVCGLTQKECHQQWRSIHDPTDPDKCPFRGPEYISNKQIRENVMQYNLKHPKKEKDATTNKNASQLFVPPSQPAIVKSSSVQDPNTVQDKTHVPFVGKAHATPSFSADSLINFIENINQSDDQNLHTPKVAMTNHPVKIKEDNKNNIHDDDHPQDDQDKNMTDNISLPTEFFPDTSETIPPSQFYKIQK
jgi:hypothetical protein